MNPHDSNSLFNLAFHLAEHGDLQASAEAYDTCIRTAQDSAASWTLDELAKLLRSAAINSAQVLNKLGKFAQALERIEMAVANSPTATGWAIALAAQGEALCRLGRLK